MPPQIPIWMPILGDFVAIIIVKQLFGGLGQNFMNPALAGRCFLMLSFAGKMTNFAVSKSSHAIVDTVSQATPLATLKNQGFIEGTSIPVKICSLVISRVRSVRLPPWRFSSVQ